MRVLHHVLTCCAQTLLVDIESRNINTKHPQVDSSTPRSVPIAHSQTKLPNRFFRLPLSRLKIMAQTLYPRGTVKKIVKAHANRPLSKNVDILVRTRFTLGPGIRTDQRFM